MASKTRNRQAHNKPRNTVANFFYLDDKLYRVLFKDKPTDLLVAWDYEERKSKDFIYSQVIRRHKRSWDTGEVAWLLNRRWDVVRQYIRDGLVPKPPRTYSLDGEFRPGRLRWSEKHIYTLHEALLQIHHGRPRKDGRIRPHPKTPSRAELRAKMNNEAVYYVKDEKTGEFKRVWKEPEW